MFNISKWVVLHYYKLTLNDYYMEDFKCCICGKCCMHVDQVLGNIQELSKIIGDENATFPFSHTNGVCEKLSKENRCLVYNDRPIICNSDKLIKIIMEISDQDPVLVRKYLIEQAKSVCQLLQKN